jgi:hypothetical protein
VWSRGADAGLRQRNSYLESREMIRSGLLDRSQQAACSQTKKHKEATRSHVRRLWQSEQDKMGGRTLVEVAEITQPTSTLQEMNLAGEEAAEAEHLKGSSAEGGPRQTRGRGMRGEMGLESIIVKLPVTGSC